MGQGGLAWGAYTPASGIIFKDLGVFKFLCTFPFPHHLSFFHLEIRHSHVKVYWERNSKGKIGPRPDHDGISVIYMGEKILWKKDTQEAR